MTAATRFPAYDGRHVYPAGGRAHHTAARFHAPRRSRIPAARRALSRPEIDGSAQEQDQPHVRHGEVAAQVGAGAQAGDGVGQGQRLGVGCVPILSGPMGGGNGTTTRSL